tara:strand:- start:1618 stop:2133 length:516 start_codon:yes stop_codon:yes gene_type:complete
MNKKIINVPNSITLLRLISIPFFIMLYVNGNIKLSLILLVLMVLSDKLDGFSAKFMKQNTKFGGGFDSFTDYVMIISVLVMFMLVGRIQIYWIIVLLFPTLIIAFIKILYGRKRKKFPVTIFAKLTVGFIYLVLISILIGFSFVGLMMAIMVVMSYISMVIYIARFVKKDF